MSDNLTIFSCSNFSKEVKAVIQGSEYDDVVFGSLTGRCGHPPVTINEVLTSSKSDNSQENFHVLGGCCLSADFLSSTKHNNTKYEQCFYMFCNKGIIDSFIARGSYLITPGWLYQWKQHISKWGFDQNTARAFFAESAKDLVLLDTGIESNSRKNIEEFSNYINLPYEILYVGLDHLKLIIENIVLEWRSTREKAEQEKINASQLRKSAEDAMFIDLINNLTESLDENAVVKSVFDIFQMLFAPSSIHYLPLVQGTTEELISNKKQNNPSILTKGYEEIISGSLDNLWIDTDDGFILKINHMQDTLGYFILEGLLFPELKDKYHDLGLTLAAICGLAITNARKYRLLEETQLLLEATIESPKDMSIFSLDSNFNYTAFNSNHKRTMHKLYKVNIEIGMNILEVMSIPEVREMWRRSFERVLKGESFSEMQKLPGLDIYFGFNWNPIISENDEVIGITCFKNDITERLLAQEEVRLHSEIMTNMAEGVYLIGLDDGKIVYTNPRFEEMFGYDSGEMIGKNVSIVNAPTDKEPEQTVEEIMEELQSKGEWHGEVENITKDGTHFWCYANVSIFEHQQYGKVLVSVHTDITERKIVEKEKEDLITKLNKTLEEVKTLKDFIPICSGCKKIRDDKGYWNQIESYIQERTGSEFSHGICPDCKERLYGDMLRNIKT